MKKNDFSFEQNFILKKIEKQQEEYVAIFERKKTKEIVKVKINDILKVDDHLEYKILNIDKNQIKVENLLNNDEFILNYHSYNPAIISLIIILVVFAFVIVIAIKTLKNETKEPKHLLNNVNLKTEQYHQQKVFIKKTINQKTEKKIESNNKLIKKIEFENKELKKELKILKDEINKNREKLNSVLKNDNLKETNNSKEKFIAIEKNLYFLNQDVIEIKNNIEYLKAKETDNTKAINNLSSNILNNLSKLIKNQYNLSIKNQVEIKKLKKIYVNLLQTNKKLIETNIRQMKKINELVKKIEKINNQKIKEEKRNVLNTYKVPFYFIGTTTENGQIYAYISSLTNQIYKVAKGDVINNKYKVIDINKQRMILENIINNKLILLKLKQGK